MKPAKRCGAVLQPNSGCILIGSLMKLNQMSEVLMHGRFSEELMLGELYRIMETQLGSLRKI